MSTTIVSRNRSVRLGSKVNAYGHEDEARREGHHSRHVWMTNSNLNRMVRSLSYRKDRARRRQIYLQTYKLGSGSREECLRYPKLKKMAVKVKNVVVSTLAFMRGGELRPCTSPLAIRASSPTRPM
ncbi:Unknown protein [Striga hermonthica]|uniref:Uncharacterized protein n=1 Tax=Striga hermonthica TaxID=68872 RepID=A0A9N7MNR5_STRHE|nr:Unknown protein [Striga hermonthica]